MLEVPLRLIADVGAVYALERDATPYMANGRTEEHENDLGVPLLHFQLSDEADHARQEW